MTYGKVTLDLDALVRSGDLSAESARSLARLGTPSRLVGRLVQVLYILGALGLAAGVLALKPDPATGLVLALAALAFAVWAKQSSADGIDLLGTAMAIAGTFGICGWIGLQFGEQAPGILINGLATLIIIAAALYFNSLFLIAFVPLGLAAMIGSGTFYWHAAYGIFVQEPMLTVVLFALLSSVLLLLEPRLNGIRAKQAVIAARMSFIAMNMGFWVGSLWGDWPGEHFMRGSGDDNTPWEQVEAWRQTAFHIPDLAFALVWALVCAALIAALRKNRFVMNAAITFLAINAYTQYFERFGDSPVALIVGVLRCSPSLGRSTGSTAPCLFQEARPTMIERTASGRTLLFVMATEAEYGVELRKRITPLNCGVGPVEGGIGLTRALAERFANGTLPDCVVSLGSAGSRILEQGVVYQVAAVAYRDMDASPLGFEKGCTPFLDLPARVALPRHIDGVPSATLSTGANIVSGAAYDLIEEDMVDMETFAHLRACQAFGVELIGLRGISDGADELRHFSDWADALPALDRHLAEAVDRLVASL